MSFPNVNLVLLSRQTKFFNFKAVYNLILLTFVFNGVSRGKHTDESKEQEK